MGDIMPNTKSKQNKTSRLTIGMITDWVGDQYQLDILLGASDFARQKDVNFLCFEGGGIDARNEYESRRNKVYDLISAENVDGLIILSGSIANFASMESIIKFCEQYRPMPMVLVDLTIPGIPSLSVDNGGIRELIDHLIIVHGYRKLGFIKGPESSEDGVKRFQVFLETLDEYKIPVDEQLIVQGDYSYNSGQEAMSILLDQRKATLDVVIACNDAMALGALHELNIRGIRVPEEMAVAGFDNLESCRFSSPPLTTVGYSIYELGRRSAEMIINLLVQKEVPLVDTIPAKLIIRQSCGCPPAVMSGIISPSTMGTYPVPNHNLQIGEWEGKFTIDTHKVAAGVTHKVAGLFSRNGGFPLSQTIENLIQAIVLELNGENINVFFKTWNETLDSALQMGPHISDNTSDISLWQIVISEIRNQLTPYLIHRELLIQVETLLQQARIMIDEKILKMEMVGHHEVERVTRLLDYLREQLLMTIDESGAMDILAGSLPGIGIKSCYIIMYTGKKQIQSRLVLAYDEHGRSEKNRSTLALSTQLPRDIYTRKRQSSMLAVALNFNKLQSGLLLFEISPRDGKVYGELRRIIHSTMQAIILFQQIQKQAEHLMLQKESLHENLAQSKKIMIGFIKAIGLMVETRDLYTAGHQYRVADLACAIALEMKLSRDRIEGIKMAGMVHDLGKLYIPTEILNKPSRLNELEYRYIQTHSEIAYNILKNIDFNWPIAQIILQHHEKIDGSGYPMGLKGQDILLEARILAVADVVEAMTSHRPYRAACSIDDALAGINEKRGLLYDGEVVDQCIKLFHQKGFRFTPESRK
jgi:HD-GYP domain-containing protein (c-di-GMP phosphodiesterase class II)/DNA-binding LacI/PurR family transcriptional regulator